MKETLQEMAARVAEDRCGRGCGGCPAESWRDENGGCLIRRLAKIKNVEEQVQKLKIWANTNPKAPELQPCPFCGGAAEYIDMGACTSGTGVELEGEGMKTPEEIKKGLELCPQQKAELCNKCPYWCGGAVCIARILEDARDYIEQLEDNIAEGNRMVAHWFRVLPRWISVKERRPERAGLYYCHTAMWGDIMCRYANGR